MFDNHALIEMLRLNTQGDSLGRLWAIFTVSKQKIADNWPQAWGFISRYQIFALIDKTLAVEYDTHSQIPNTPSWEMFILSSEKYIVLIQKNTFDDIPEILLWRFEKNLSLSRWKNTYHYFCKIQLPSLFVGYPTLQPTVHAAPMPAHRPGN